MVNNKIDKLIVIDDEPMNQIMILGQPSYEKREEYTKDSIIYWVTERLTSIAVQHDLDTNALEEIQMGEFD